MSVKLRGRPAGQGGQAPVLAPDEITKNWLELPTTDSSGFAQSIHPM